MSAEEARIAKALEAIAQSNKELVKGFRALNENVVAFAQIFSTWAKGNLDLENDPNQLTLDEDVECKVCGLHHRASEARDDV